MRKHQILCSTAIITSPRRASHAKLETQSNKPRRAGFTFSEVYAPRSMERKPTEGPLILERPKCIRSGRIILDDLASHRSRVRKWEKESLSLKWAWTRRRARLALQVLRTVVGVVAVFHPASIQKKHSVPRGMFKFVRLPS